jgi:hypothetical protein
MFTKTSGSKRFTSGISRSLKIAFSVRPRTIMYGAYVSDSVNLTSTFLLTIFVQEYRQSSHTTVGKTITSIVSSNHNCRKQ